MKGRIVSLGYGLDGDLMVTLSLARSGMDELKALQAEDIDCTVKKYRQKRSLSANAYAWTLITKIAQSMRPPLNKEEVYVEMLKRYGQGDMVSIRKDRAQALRAFDYYEVKGEGVVNGREFLHVMVYVGSSKYNTQEMNIFISGIVEEARDLGIETMTPVELARLEVA